MRVKVGDTWYEATFAQPIMVELTDVDKANIANMLPTATRYAIFDDDHELQSVEDKMAWMEEGARPAHISGPGAGVVSEAQQKLPTQGRCGS